MGRVKISWRKQEFRMKMELTKCRVKRPMEMEGLGVSVFANLSSFGTNTMEETEEQGNGLDISGVTLLGFKQLVCGK